MMRPFLFYISASAELVTERDLLSRAVTEIPVDVPWRIVQSPDKNQPLNSEALLNSDLHILILGGDIKAPIGLEYRIARTAGRRPHLFLKSSTRRTMAAANFKTYLEMNDKWQNYQDGGQLRLVVLRLLIRRILKLVNRFELSSAESEELKLFRNQMEDITQESSNIEGGAGDSSLILSLKRYRPSNGILLDQQREGFDDLDVYEEE